MGYVLTRTNLLTYPYSLSVLTTQEKRRKKGVMHPTPACRHPARKTDIAGTRGVGVCSPEQGVWSDDDPTDGRRAHPRSIDFPDYVFSHGITERKRARAVVPVAHEPEGRDFRFVITDTSISTYLVIISRWHSL